MSGFIVMFGVNSQVCRDACIHCQSCEDVGAGDDTHYLGIVVNNGDTVHLVLHLTNMWSEGFLSGMHAFFV